MRISGSNSFNNVDIQQPTQNKPATSAPANLENSVSNAARPATADGRASVKGAEGSISSSLVANSLRTSIKSLNLGNVLKNIADAFHPASSSAKSGKTLLERAKTDSDQSDAVQGAGPARGASTTPHLVNNGGKVLSSPAIDNIYVGSYFNTTQGKADAAHQDAAAKAWVGSGNEGILKQYGVGKGSFVGSTTVNVKAPKTYTAANGEALIKQLLASGAIKAGDQTIHTINLPPGTVLKDGSATSKNGLGGFHGSYTDPSTGKEVYYAILANNKGSNGIDFTGGNQQDNNSIVASHEWSEASTDADVSLVNRTGDNSKLGYYDNTYGEIGDIAINISQDPNLKDVWGKEGGFAFQKEWSNQDNHEMQTTTQQ